MSDMILFIFEGEKTEKRLVDNLRQHFLNEDDTIIYASFNTHIYKLYQEIEGYDDENVDTVEVLLDVLRAKKTNTAHLTDVSRRNVSQVYLFFDYDGHDTSASDEVISKMLAHFDDETENGKLYISYPMVEAIKHIHQEVGFETVCVEAKTNVGYKALASNNCDPCYNQVGRYTKEQWQTLIGEHCKKLDYLMSSQFTLPTQYFAQDEIFDQQLANHITPY
ncbi:MAG: hypothetical protein MJK04_13265, partial [Psychrosphaera sp.]|nr:hypothetical protein [Psychrosphaera sp.]